MRMVFFGTTRFAATVLAALLQSRHSLLAVVSQPDRPTGRGLAVHPTPVRAMALEYGIPTFAPEKSRNPEFVAEIEALAADVLVVAAYGQILSERLLNAARFGGLNTHASLLPKYRGAAPIQHAIMEGETVTGITIMQMDKGMDTGDIRIAHELPIGPDDTHGTLEPKLAELAAIMVVEALDLLEAGRLSRTPQAHADATYAAMIRKEDGEVDWRQPAARIQNLIRAVTPRPGAFFRHGGKTVRVLAVEPTTGSGSPGEVLCVKPSVEIACRDGGVRLGDVQPEGKRPMNAADYANGYRLAVGERLPSADRDV